MSTDFYIEFRTDRRVKGLIFLELFAFLVFLIFIWENSWLFPIVLLLPAVLVLYEIMYIGSAVIKLNSQGIEACYMFGKYRIDWADVEQIQETWAHMFFIGQDKQFTIPSTANWVVDMNSNYTVGEIFSMIESLVEQEIQGKTIPLPYFPKWHNTKISE